MRPYKNMRSDRLYVILFIVVSVTLFVDLFPFFVTPITRIQNKDIEEDEYYEISPHNITDTDIVEFKEIILKINKEQIVYNKKLKKDNLQNTIIIVIHVEEDYYSLLKTLDSLRLVRNITSALLVFSHEYYREDIHNLVRNVTFASYTQIYYMYSIQLNPTVFPANDAKFCNTHVDCRSEDRRNATLCQKKNFWWWTVNKMFNSKLTKDNDSIVFLEAGQYVTEDFIYIVNRVEDMKPVYCSECEFICLGAHPYESPAISSKVFVEKFSAGRHYMGLVINKSTWRVISSNNIYCDTNDYRWNHSLISMGEDRPSNGFYILSIFPPRVYLEDDLRIDFNSTEKEKAYIFNRYVRDLFPTHLPVIFKDRELYNTSANIGQYCDVRDRDLCLSFSKRRNKISVEPKTIDY